MNLLKRIKIENIKGKDKFEINFNELTANQPNIIVAPNGYGKSTIATAFKAAQSGKLKINPNDIYKKNPQNHPKLEIELVGEHAGVFVATETDSNISSNFTIDVINSSLYAKSTLKSFSQRTTATADLCVEDIVIFDRIPEKKSFNYSYSNIKSSFGDKGKLFLNISHMICDSDNIEKIYNIRESIKKCIQQKKIKNSFSYFLDKCSNTGTVTTIKRNIPDTAVTKLYENPIIAELLETINNMSNKPDNWLQVDIVFTAIQICKIIEIHLGMGDTDIFKAVYTYSKYKKTKSLIDKRLLEFNTTGRDIKTHEEQGKLRVHFERAGSMSNGERDILSFIINLIKFEQNFKKNIGILIIDEVFDYLDGSNILAVQYYLSELINKCKRNDKILFPIILTHLDPAVFANYYFKKQKIHYISLSGIIDLNSDIIKMLRLRESRTLSCEEKNVIEQYYIHYIDECYNLSEDLALKISNDFSYDNISFRTLLYDEITNKYLKDNPYNPIMIIAGLRIKIEELIYSKINNEDKEEFINKHSVINKLNYATDKGVDVEEIFYLLQPLYNDGLHLRGDDNAVKSKIKSCYLKTNNFHVKRMIRKLFE